MPNRLAFLTLAIALAGPALAADPADTVFRNASVYTMDATRSWASAVAIRDGRIVYVGDEQDIGAYIHHTTRVINLNGRMIMPGFHDSHIHPMSGGLRLVRCSLIDVAWPDAVYERIRKCSTELPDGEWLVATGLAMEAFDGDGPGRRLLDELVPDRPAWIRSDSGFSTWANTQVFEAAGIDTATLKPDQGKLAPEWGSDGRVLQDQNSLSNLIYRAIPVASPQQYRKALQKSLQKANRYGITSIIDASIDNENMLAAYMQSENAGELSVRVVASQRANGENGPIDIDELVSRSKRYRGKRFRANAAKIFSDGQFALHNAALLEEYSDTPAYYGQMNIERKQLIELIVRLDAECFQIHTHSFGDRAVRNVLDALEIASDKNESRDRRHQIAHLQIIDAKDIPRFRELGVVADFQPLWAWADPDTLVLSEPILGPERSKHQVEIASVANSGATIVAGSDWPSESMNPLVAIQIAITRRPLDGSAPAWLPWQRVDLETMLAAYTINGAWLAREDKINGSIEVGKAADLIVLDQNLFDVDPMKIKDVQVLLTLLDGQPVYRDPRISWHQANQAN